MSAARVAAFGVALGIALAGCGREDVGTIPLTPPPPPQTFPVASKLPVLRVNTAGGAPVVSRDDYLAATFSIADTFGVVRLEGPTDIRGRGNTTWDLMPKKPFRLRLGTSAPVLGMPAGRHWVLLANYSDKTLMRNDVVFELSRMLGFAYTTRAEYVDFYLNGRYDGVYQIGEHIRIDEDRVDIDELEETDTSAEAITGGYLIEVDQRRGEDFCIDSKRTPMIFCLKEPETLLEPEWAPHRAYIEGYIAATDDAIFGPSFADPVRGYAAYLDVASAIDYYLLNELVKNVDGNLRLSTFLHKPRGGKLTFGPVWDYDIAIGNVNYDGADRVQGWHSRQAAWYARMFEDPAFDARVRARWRQIRADGTVDRLFTYIGRERSYLSAVQVRNFERWPILGTYVWPNRVVTGSYAGEVQAMRDWLLARRNWMDAQLGL